jgi:hypothetical protein
LNSSVRTLQIRSVLQVWRLSDSTQMVALTLLQTVCTSRTIQQLTCSSCKALFDCFKKFSLILVSDFQCSPCALLYGGAVRSLSSYSQTSQANSIILDLSNEDQCCYINRSNSSLHLFSELNLIMADQMAMTNGADISRPPSALLATTYSAPSPHPLGFASSKCRSTCNRCDRIRSGKYCIISEGNGDASTLMTDNLHSLPELPEDGLCSWMLIYFCVLTNVWLSALSAWPCPNS